MNILKLLAVPLLALSMIFAGCTAQSGAQEASDVIQAILTVATAEEASVPAQDAVVYKEFVTLGNTLESQLQSCNTAAVSSGSKKATFLACFNAFATGLTNSQELSEVRLVSSPTQHKIQVYVTAIVAGVNVGIAAFSGIKVSPPAVSSQAATKAELQTLRQAIGR